MGAAVVLAGPEGRVLGRFRLLTCALARMRGLLGTTRDAAAVLLVPCSSIHTVGMAYAIDVAFVDGDGTVALSRRGVGPGRVLRCRGALGVLERPATQRWWPEAGTTLRAMEGSDAPWGRRDGAR